MVYDPAWDMPQVNWQQQGSYEQGSIPPVIEPDAGTQVWLGPVAREWLPWICGSLDQLRNPSAWIVADDMAMYNTLRRVDTLLGLVCGNGGSEMPIMVRFQNCVLQTSADGGVTWVDVPGWTANFANCVHDVLPPPPPQIGPGPIQQYACNLAGYVATQVIQTALQAAVTDWNNGVRLFSQAVTLFHEIAAEALPLTDLALLAGQDLFAWFAAGTIGDLQSSSTDPLLWSDVTCAIYNAIKNDGQITDANYPQIVINVCAITYAHPVAVSAICSFVTRMGAINMRKEQIAGAFDTVDCSHCANFCKRFDFSVNDGGWITNPAGFSSRGVYTPGVGWQSTIDTTDCPGDAFECLQIKVTLPRAMVIRDIRAFFSAGAMGTNSCYGPDSGARSFNLFLGGVSQLVAAVNTPVTSPCMSQGGSPISVLCDEIWLGILTENPGSRTTLCAVEIRAEGINPYGADSCVP
jgi:hypothetical protein